MDFKTIDNLQKLIDNDSNILLIEIWKRVLYIRMKKGRNKFHSKKGITTLSSGIYINLINFRKSYKNAQLRFHPDLNANNFEISKGLNQWKQLLSECDKREFNRTEFNKLISAHPDGASIFSSVQSIRIILEQETGFFNGYIKVRFPTDDEIAKTKAWWEEETARQCGRNKDGTKYVDPYEGTIPF